MNPLAGVAGAIRAGNFLGETWRFHCRWWRDGKRNQVSGKVRATGN